MRIVRRRSLSAPNIFGSLSDGEVYKPASEPRLAFASRLRLNIEELCRRHDLATLILPDLKQVVIPADEVIRTAGGCAFKDSIIRGVIHNHLDASLRLDVFGKSRDLAKGGIHTILRPAELRPEQNAIHLVV